MVRMMKCLGLGFALRRGLALAPAAGITVTIGTSVNEHPEAGKPVVAVFSLDGPIVERPQGEELPLFAPPPRPSFKDIVERMKKAADDKNVKGVVLMLDEVDLGLAQIEEFRQHHALGPRGRQEVYAHVDNVLTMRALALAAGATRISVTPTAVIMINGIDAESPYLRGLLDKIGVKPDFVTCGEYKSATEIFMRKGPSPEAKRMTNWLLDSLYESFLKMVAQGRGVKPERVPAVDRRGDVFARSKRATGDHRPRPAPAGLRGRAAQRLRRRRAIRPQPQQEARPDRRSLLALGIFEPLVQLAEGGPEEEGRRKNLIGIVYVEGTIMTGKPEPSPFSPGPDDAYSTPLRKALDKLADNKDVKAVVLRVNSPGGSAMASEIIFNAVQRVKLKKPVSCRWVPWPPAAVTTSRWRATRFSPTPPRSPPRSGSWAASSPPPTCGTTSASPGTATAAAPTPGCSARRARFPDRTQAGPDLDERGLRRVQGSRRRRPRSETPKAHRPIGRRPGVYRAAGRSWGWLTRSAAWRTRSGTPPNSPARLTDYELRSFPEPKNFLELFVEDLSDGEHDPNHVSLAAPWLGASWQDFAPLLRPGPAAPQGA